MRSFSFPRPGPAAEWPSRRREAVSAVLVAGIAVVVGSSGFVALAGFAPTVAVGALLAFALLALMVVHGVERYHPHARFGPANRITLVRAALNAVLAGLLLQPAVLLAGWQDGLGWSILGLALLSLSLDGLDGLLARRTGEMSRFGARFDIEVDAGLLWLLGALLVVLDRVGLWVLAGSALYHLFVAARRVWPWLQRELPPARRRKVIFVVHVVMLFSALVPAVEPPSTAVLACLGVVALAGSFLVDLRWLYRHAEV